MLTRNLFRLVWLGIGLCLAPVCHGQAAESRRAWDLISQDAAAVLQVNQLRTFREELVRHPLLKRWREHPLGKLLERHPEWLKLQESLAIVQTVTGDAWTVWLDRLAGTQVCLVVFPAPDEPQFLLLTRLEDEQSWDNFRKHWNRLEPAEEEKHIQQKRSWTTRHPKEGNGSPDLHFALVDGWLVLSLTPERLQQSLTLADNSRESLASAQKFQRTRGLLGEQAPFEVFLDLQAWIKNTPPKVDVEPANIGKIWVTTLFQGIRTVAIRLSVKPQLHVLSILEWGPVEKESDWARQVAKMRGPPRFLGQVPANSFACLAGKHDIPGFVKTWGPQIEQIDPKTWKILRTASKGAFLGLDFFSDIIPAMPSDWGVCLLPGDMSTAYSSPADVLLGIAIPNSPVTLNGPAVPLAMDNAIRTGLYLTAAAKQNDGEGWQIQEEEVGTGKYTLRWVDILPALQPAAVVLPEVMLLATHPANIRNILAIKPTATLANEPRFKQLQEQFFAPANQVLYLNFQVARDYTTEQRAQLLKLLEEQHHLSAEEAARRLKRISEWLELCDIAFLAGEFEEDHARFTLGIVVEPDQTKP